MERAQADSGKPNDLPTQETADFIASRLASGAEILEVGCGEGHVASELERRGFRITGVDPNPTVIAHAQQRGVRAVVGLWPQFDSGKVDAVAFTHSLHHISPLGPAIDKVLGVLNPDGWLLIDDFAFGEADPPTIEWFMGVLRSPRATAVINPHSSHFIAGLLAAADPVAAWHGAHHHELHSITTITEAVAERFTIIEARELPYLYRYLISSLPETPEAAAFVADVFRQEGDLGAQGKIMSIGRRIAARPPG
jgi:SAM-dependent methyltransferase